MDRLMTLTRATGVDDPIVGLAATAELRSELERLEAVLVRRARVRGRTWTEIATVLGVSKQAVHKKHGRSALFGRRNA